MDYFDNNKRIPIAFTELHWEAIRTAIDYTNAKHCKPNDHEAMAKVYSALSNIIKYELIKTQNEEEAN